MHYLTRALYDAAHELAQRLEQTENGALRAAFVSYDVEAAAQRLEGPPKWTPFVETLNYEQRQAWRALSDQVMLLHDITDRRQFGAVGAAAKSILQGEPVGLLGQTQ